MPANSQRNYAAGGVHISIDTQDKPRCHGEGESNGQKKCSIEIFHMALHIFSPEYTGSRRQRAALPARSSREPALKSMDGATTRARCPKTSSDQQRRRENV